MSTKNYQLSAKNIYCFGVGVAVGFVVSVGPGIFICAFCWGSCLGCSIFKGAGFCTGLMIGVGVASWGEPEPVQI